MQNERSQDEVATNLAVSRFALRSSFPHSLTSIRNYIVAAAARSNHRNIECNAGRRDACPRRLERIGAT